MPEPNAVFHVEHPFNREENMSARVTINIQMGNTGADITMTNDTVDQQTFKDAAVKSIITQWESEQNYMLFGDTMYPKAHITRIQVKG